jgi:hypothetical protein
MIVAMSDVTNKSPAIDKENTQTKETNVRMKDSKIRHVSCRNAKEKSLRYGLVI